MFLLHQSDTPLSNKLLSLSVALQKNRTVILFPLFFGLISGSIFGTFTASNVFLQNILRFFRPGTEHASFLYSILHSFRFILCIALFSSAIFGVLLIPLLAYLRGFLLSGSVALAFQIQSFRGMAIGALSVGVPALLSFPAFLLASIDGWSFSRDLAACAVQRAPRPFEGNESMPEHLILILLLTMLDAIYSFYLLPLLMKLIH